MEREVTSATSMWSACVELYTLTLRRQIASRQTIACVALSFLLLLIVVASSRRFDPEKPKVSQKKLAENVLVPTFISFLLPIFAISYGASGIGGEREDQTLIYLLISPIPRALIYLIKALAALTLTGVWVSLVLLALCRAGGPPGQKLFFVFISAGLLGVWTYSALFLLVGSLFRHGTILSLVYWFFLEVLFGNLPGIIKRVSVTFYIRCMIYEAGGDLELGPMAKVAREMYLPISGSNASIVLVMGLLVLLGVGLVSFEHRES